MTEFQSNAYVVGCDLKIVSGTDTVKIYCGKTSYTTIFTSSISCAYNLNPFMSTGAVESFFSKLFQWGDGIAEGGDVTNNTTSLGWTEEQKKMLMPRSTMAKVCSKVQLILEVMVPTAAIMVLAAAESMRATRLTT